MADKLVEALADVKNAGVDTRSIDYVTEFDLSADSHNISAGMLRGLGPRYGMAPLVSQSIEQNVDGRDTYGILGSSNPTDTARAVYGSFRVYGIQTVPLIDQADVGTTNSPKQRKTYFWVCLGVAPTAGDATGLTMLCWVPLGVSTSSFWAWSPRAALAYGLLRPLVLSPAATFGVEPGNYRLSGTNTAGGSTYTQFRNVQNIAQVSGTLDYCATAVLGVAGQNVPAPWIVGSKVTDGDADTSATANFTNYGCPNFPIDRKFTTGARTWSLLNIGGIGLEAEYDFSKTPTYTDLAAVANQATTPAHLAGTFVDGSATLVQRVDATAPTYAQVGDVLWNDPANFMNTEHTLLLAAPGKPLALLLQGWQREGLSNLEQWIDLRKRRFSPPVRQTLDIDGIGTTRYTESGDSGPSATPVSTCWAAWEPYVSGAATRELSSLSRAAAPVSVALGAADTGILRADTVYEFTYAVYDKQLGIESNVGVPAKIRTDAADFVALCLWADEVDAGPLYRQRCPYLNSSLNIFGVTGQNFLSEISASSRRVINYTQFRVYYRPLGAFEWLPALFIDAAQFYFSPNLKELWACAGDSVGSVGGQPGGFNDFSDLPDDAYTCVLVWKQRVFWLSAKSLIFSLTNNGFSYPVANAVPIPQGEYKGALVHNYPGQADQDSRLIVFGSKETYVGKFTGERSQMAVQVSPDDIGTFFVDGSDFILNPWTSVTAFSYRSACVADGILYYWGPQGVYRDDARDTPTKISDGLEPDIFNLYAKQRTDDIHCTYSEQTKEIVWFYFDNTVYTTYSATEEQTKLLIYNTQTEEFFFGGTSACVDGSQKIISGSGTMDLVRETGGDRTVVFSRVSKASTGVQQAYFFDYRNRAGDMRYGLERMVNVIATPSAGTRRLTLPNGATGIAVGDLIATDQINAYTNDQTSAGAALVLEDFIGKVTAVNTVGTNYIDVLMPTNIDPAFSASGTLGALNAFPIYVNKSILAANATAGNAFNYAIASQYWCPFGMKFNAFWTYCHFLFKITLLKAEGLDESFGVDFSHRSPTSLDYISEFMVFGKEELGTWVGELNSDGSQQIYHPLDIGNDNFQGQGLKLKLSGLHYAHRWVLQYLAMYGNPQTFDFLKQFEG